MFYEPELKGYFPTREYEEDSDVRKFIEEFENDSFWDELITRLAERDFGKEVGEGIKEMSVEKRFQRLSELEEKYAEEFEREGLRNLRCANRNPDLSSRSTL